MIKIKVVTHDSHFHTDDVFATATILLLHGEENCEVIRSRNPEIIKTADIVFDVGFAYDPHRGRFDHHQEGRAGTHENGIPYAAFGLVWKEFGEKLCGSKEVAEAVEQRLVIPIDSFDNGLMPFSKSEQGIFPYTIDHMVDAFTPPHGKSNFDECFWQVVPIAKGILEREIHKCRNKVEDRKKVRAAYRSASDKRLIVFDEGVSWREAILEFPEPLFIVSPRRPNNDGSMWWDLKVVQDGYPYSFTTRKSLPQAWKGKERQELEKVTGVKGSVFCHDGLFLAVADSKEGALALAQLALEA